jgi:hypothetical protein
LRGEVPERDRGLGETRQHFSVGEERQFQPLGEGDELAVVGAAAAPDPPFR